MLESLFNKVAALQACIFIKNRLQHSCFPVNIATFSRTTILKKKFERLLLVLVQCQLTFEIRLNTFWLILKDFAKLASKLYKLSQITEYFLTTASVSSFICLSYLSKKVEPAVDMYNSI